MPDTKNFSQRIATLDEILGGFRRLTFEELLDKLNEKLDDAGYKKVSKKTLFNDLKYLRDEKDAPISKPSRYKPHYYYTKKFSVKDLPLTDEEIDYLKQAAEILKRAAPFLVSTELETLISKLENKIHTNVPERTHIIQFESHTKAAGEQWLDQLFSAVKEKVVLRIQYKPFHKEEASELIFHPYLLKEYRNRWFIFGRVGEFSNVTNLALDRIKGIKNSSQPFSDNNLFDPDTYFKHLVGVSIPRDGEIEEVTIKVKSASVSYIKTKPIHNLQEVVKEYKNGDLLLKIPLYINHELKSLLLSYGEGIEIIAPDVLKTDIAAIIHNLDSFYNH
jgi:predicted DNA-binding transcriptional regulator YafY